VKVLLYVIWALFVMGAVVSIVYMARKTGSQERLAADWPRARATVTGSRAGWTSGAGNTTRNRRFFPLYKFSDSHGTLFTGESEVSCAEQPAPGSCIDVAYNPANPHESFHVSSQARATMGCLTTFFAVFSLVLLWFISVFPLP
jgi:hypothetical protein